MFKAFSDYHEFQSAVTDRTRYRFDPSVENFLLDVQESARGRIFTVNEGTCLYRAQLGHKDVVVPLSRIDLELLPPHPHEPERMVPLAHSAKEGRVNPKGIPCLYLADNPETAMSEVRPWIGAYVSVGHFTTVRDLRLIDCTAARIDHRGFLPLDIEERKAIIADAVWGEICESFSEPITDTDTTAQYAPTQILAEVFMGMRCDGIKYRSLLADGKSYALFNLDDASLVRCATHYTHAVRYAFSPETFAYTLAPQGEMRQEAVPGEPPLSKIPIRKPRKRRT